MEEDSLFDEKEIEQLTKLSKRYEKLTKKTWLNNIGEGAAKLIPAKLKEFGNKIGTTISEKELYQQCMKVAVDGFKILEQQASKCTLSEDQIIKKINKNNLTIQTLEEICTIDGTKISKIVSEYKTSDVFKAALEGAGTGAFGFAGIPFNLVLSMFLYFRAVQSIALCYGYDIKNDPSEMIIASEVFTESLNPSSCIDSESTSIVGKIMIMGQLTALKQSAKKTWEQMASKGGLPLLVTQLRALANKAAQKGLEKAGQKELENTMFREILEQVGSKLGKKALRQKIIPGIGALLGALMDASQMNKITEYADIFYHKRFIFEQEKRIEKLKKKPKIIEVK